MASHTESELARRGKNKASRHHLRQIGLGLLVARDSRLPLYYTVYPGNVHDSKQFEAIMDEMFGIVCGLHNTKQRLTVVTGIARPEPLFRYLGSKGVRFEHLAFADHHHFTDKDLRMLVERQPILTTEKDAVRLEGKLGAFWVLPVRHCFAPGEKAVMDQFLEEL